MKHEGRYSVVNLFISFLIGGISAAVLALLLTPQSGHETRQKIKDFTGEAGYKAKVYIEDVKGRITSTVEK
jgi:gas vesicle protein